MEEYNKDIEVAEKHLAEDDGYSETPPSDIVGGLCLSFLLSTL